MEDIRPTFTAYFAHKDRFDYPYEVYDCWVAFVATRGSFRCRIGECGTFQAVDAGELMLCPPQQPFFREAVTPMTLYMIKFSGSCRLDAGIYRPADPYRLRQNLQALEPDTICADLSNRPRLTHYCMDIWYQLCEDTNFFIANKTVTGSALKNVCEYIHHHIDSMLRTDYLAKLSGYSEAHLISLFHKEFGTTPNRYITRLRIDKASRLLAQTDTKIKEVAAACGFDDELYFSRVFKKHTGLCPTQYRACAKI